MVVKSKGGKKSLSVLAGKRKKSEIKYKRKYNYKKKERDKSECCVCIEEVCDESDNTITCGKVNHTLCRECKLKCEECPMCRSHNIKPPISQDIKLRIIKMHEKEEKVQKISVEGLDNLDGASYNGIYEQSSDNLYYNKEMGIYIYKSKGVLNPEEDQWVIDDNYCPNGTYAYCFTPSKLFGKNNWYVSGRNGWFKRSAKIVKL